MYYNDNLFSQRIKELRKSWGLTQQQMADMVDLRKTTISNYESGYATPTIATLKKFMSRFNLPASYFVPDMDSEISVKKAQTLYGSPVPYFEPTNLKGLKTKEPALMDSSLSLPAPLHIPKTGYIATCAPDNSMNKCGIKRGTCLIINTEKTTPSDGEIFAAVRGNFLIVRKYHNNSYGTFMTSESTTVPTGLSVEEIPSEDFQILGIIDRIIAKIYCIITPKFDKCIFLMYNGIRTVSKQCKYFGGKPRKRGMLFYV